MWFKGFPFLSYTALLVIPTSGLSNGQDEGYGLGRRAEPWKNQTRTTSHAERSKYSSTKTSTVVVTTETTEDASRSTSSPPVISISTTHPAEPVKLTTTPAAASSSTSLILLSSASAVESSSSLDVITSSIYTPLSSASVLESTSSLSSSQVSSSSIVEQTQASSSDAISSSIFIAADTTENGYQSTSSSPTKASSTITAESATIPPSKSEFSSAVSPSSDERESPSKVSTLASSGTTESSSTKSALGEELELSRTVLQSPTTTTSDASQPSSFTAKSSASDSASPTFSSLVSTETQAPTFPSTTGDDGVDESSSTSQASSILDQKSISISATHQSSSLSASTTERPTSDGYTLPTLISQTTQNSSTFDQATGQTEASFTTLTSATKIVSTTIKPTAGSSSLVSPSLHAMSDIGDQPDATSNGTTSATGSQATVISNSSSGGNVPASETLAISTDTISTTVSLPTNSGILDPSSGSGTGARETSISTSEGNVPASETLAVLTDTITASIPLSTTAGVLDPSGGFGTGSRPSQTEASNSASASSKVVNRLEEPTLSIESGFSTATLRSSGVPQASLPEFSLVGSATTPTPTAVGPTKSMFDISGVITSQGTHIPASESLSSPTASATNSISAVPSRGAGISVPLNGTGASSSGVQGPSTTRPTAIKDSEGTSTSNTSETASETTSGGLPGTTETAGSSANLILTILSTTTTSSGSIDPASTSIASESGELSRTSTASGSQDPSDASTISTDPLGASATIPTGYGESRTAPHAATSTTAAAVEGAPAPPLNKGQTAGIAVGSTTGLIIIALVAGLFVARRYSTKRAARKSTGGPYPEVAYIYDPPIRGNGNDDAEAGGAVPTGSGGASGYAAVPRTTPVPSPHYSPASIPQNPFRDPIIPSPSPSQSLNGYGGPLGNSQGHYSELANPYASYAAAREYPTMSPYDHGAPELINPGVPKRPSTTWSDPFGDPFEHDVLLNVDVRTETADSIMVLAPPPTPRTPRSPGSYSPGMLNGSQISVNVVKPPSQRYASSPDNSSSVSLPLRLYSPASFAASTSTQRTNSPPPRTASSPPIHKGWDDIKRNSDPAMIPAPLDTTTSDRKPTPPRSQRSLAVAGHMLLAGQGLPLTAAIKRKEVGIGLAPKKAGLRLEVPPSYGSPGPTISEYSPDPAVRRKRATELTFANPQLIGRDF